MMHFGKGHHRPVREVRDDARAPYLTQWPASYDRLPHEQKPRRAAPARRPLDQNPAPVPLAQPWLWFRGHWYRSLQPVLDAFIPPQMARFQRPTLNWVITGGDVWIGRLELWTPAGPISEDIGCLDTHAQDLAHTLLS